MDERQQRPDYDSILPIRKSPRGGDAPIYVFALVATIVIVSGLFAWLRLDPVPPPNSRAPQSSSAQDFP